MVSGFLISPYDQLRIFSGLAMLDLHLIEHLHRDLRVERVHDVIVAMGMHLVSPRLRQVRAGESRRLTRRVSNGRAKAADYSAAF